MAKHLKSLQSAVNSCFVPLLNTVDDSLYIFGCGDLTEYILTLCLEMDINVLGIIDDYSKEHSFHGINILGSEHLKNRTEPILLATLKSTDRMAKTLRMVNFKGKALAIKDPFSHSQNGSGLFTTPPKLIEQYKDLHKGEPCFVIGNGPSLLNTDPNLLGNFVTIACNNIFYMEGFNPDYYVAEDKVLTQDRAKTINKLPWTKFYPNVLSDWLDNGIFLNTIPGKWPKDKFSTDLTNGIEVYYTVTYAMLQLAYYLGCDPVYLIGVDHNYQVKKDQHTKNGNVFTSTKDDPNHFHPEYFGKGYRWHDPRVDRMEASYVVAKKFFEKDGRKVYNATDGGKLEVFERVSFAEIVTGN